MYKNITKELGIPPGYIYKILLIMRLTTVLLIATIMQVSAGSFAQKISLNEKNAPLEKIFDKIRLQSGYDFLFNRELLKTAKPVDINIKNADIEDALAICFKGQPFTYTLEEKTIVIKEKTPSFLERLADRWAAIDVHGRVVDQEGKPLAGATVRVEGTGKSVSTNSKGDFYLEKVEEGSVLVISFIGYVSKEVSVRKEIGNVILEISDNVLDQVQVIAYGTTIRRLSTGNVSTVTAEEIEKQPVNNPLLALQGRVPGMIITQESGVVGGVINVQIRGRNSISQEGNGDISDPLYIIDGVPFTSRLLPSTSYTLGGVEGGNPLNFLNSNDIESIDVLKDADATAIYGSRGNNGVIIITTKKGKASTTLISGIDFNQGIGYVSNVPKLLNKEQYIEMRTEAFQNDNRIPTATNARDLILWKENEYVRWSDALIGKTANYTNINASVSAGSENIHYRLNTTLNRQTSVFPGNFEDINKGLYLSLNASSQNKRFSISFKGIYNVDNNKLPPQDFTGAILTSPISPPAFNEDGALNFRDSFTGNPYVDLFNRYNTNSNNFLANGIINYEIISNLRFLISTGVTNTNINDNTAITIEGIKNFPGIVNPTGTSIFANNSIKSWIIEPQVSYDFRAGKNKIGLLMGTTFQEQSTVGQITEGQGYTNDAFLNSLAAAVSIYNKNSIHELYKYSAIYGRITYNLFDKYLLNLSARRDGSSRFGPGKQFGDFGALGAAWIFSEERFIKSKVSFLSFGKLRLSYGSVGNQPGVNYKYLELYNLQNYGIPYQGSQSLIPNNIFAPDFAWEVNKKAELSIELGFFKERVLLTSSYFKNRSSNQLVNYTLPSISGFYNITANLPAKVQNSGWEFTLNTLNIKSKFFTWKSNLNLSILRNELLSFPNLQNSPYSNSLIIGESLSIIKAFNSSGVDSRTGVYQFYDKSGNLTFDPKEDDKTILINVQPKFFGGINNSFSIRGFDLDFFFQFVKQTGLNYLFAPNIASAAPGVSFYNKAQDVMNRWQKQGDISNVQKFTSSVGPAYQAYIYATTSNLAYTDASFIRLKNVSLSYQLPKEFVKKIQISNAKLYCRGQNLWTITKYRGVDPENQSLVRLPPLRVFSVGLNVGF